MQVIVFSVKEINISKSSAYAAKLTVEDDAGNVITCFFRDKAILEDFIQEVHIFSVSNQSPS